MVGTLKIFFTLNGVKSAFFLKPKMAGKNKIYLSVVKVYKKKKWRHSLLSYVWKSIVQLRTVDLSFWLSLIVYSQSWKNVMKDMTCHICCIIEPWTFEPWTWTQTNFDPYYGLNNSIYFSDSSEIPCSFPDLKFCFPKTKDTSIYFFSNFV